MKITTDHITYLGDGVYCQFDGYGFVLRANHHDEHTCSDQIYLEPDVINSLNNFVQRIKIELQAKQYEEARKTVEQMI